MPKVPRTAIKEALTGIVNVITFSKDNTLTVKRSYYYRFDMTPESIAEHCKVAMEKAGITSNLLETGDHMHAFVGGAKSGSAKDSYMWAKFQIA